MRTGASPTGRTGGPYERPRRRCRTRGAAAPRPRCGCATAWQRAGQPRAASMEGRRRRAAACAGKRPRPRADHCAALPAALHALPASFGLTLATHAHFRPTTPTKPLLLCSRNERPPHATAGQRPSQAGAAWIASHLQAGLASHSGRRGACQRGSAGRRWDVCCVCGAPPPLAAPPWRAATPPSSKSGGRRGARARAAAAPGPRPIAGRQHTTPPPRP